MDVNIENIDEWKCQILVNVDECENIGEFECGKCCWMSIIVNVH